MHRRQPHHTRASEATRPGGVEPPGIVSLVVGEPGSELQRWFKCFIICKLQCPLKQGGRATNLARAGHRELEQQG